MKLKKTLKILSFLLVITLLTSNGTISMAADNPDIGIQPFYTYVSGISPGVSVSNGTAFCSTTVIVYSKSTTFEIKILLERSSDGSTFSPVTTWANTYSGYDATMECSTTNKISSGFYYRNNTTITVKSGSTVLETINAPSAIKYYY